MTARSLPAFALPLTPCRIAFLPLPTDSDTSLEGGRCRGGGGDNKAGGRCARAVVALETPPCVFFEEPECEQVHSGHHAAAATSKTYILLPSSLYQFCWRFRHMVYTNYPPAFEPYYRLGRSRKHNPFIILRAAGSRRQGREHHYHRTLHRRNLRTHVCRWRCKIRVSAETPAVDMISSCILQQSISKRPIGYSSFVKSNTADTS